MDRRVGETPSTDAVVLKWPASLFRSSSSLADKVGLWVRTLSLSLSLSLFMLSRQGCVAGFGIVCCLVAFAFALRGRC